MAVVEKDFIKFESSDFYCLLPYSGENRGWYTGENLDNRVINGNYSEYYLYYSFKRKSDGRAVIYEDDDGYQYILGSGVVNPFSDIIAFYATGQSTQGGSFVFSPQTTEETGVFNAVLIPDISRKFGGQRAPMPTTLGEELIHFGEDTNDRFLKLTSNAGALTKKYPKVTANFDADLSLGNDLGSNFILHASETVDVIDFSFELSSTEEDSSAVKNVLLDDYYSRFNDYCNDLNTYLRTSSTVRRQYIPYGSVRNSVYDQGIRGEYGGSKFYNVIITHDYDAAKKFIEDGTIPSDATVNDSLSKGDDSNESGEDGNKTDTFDENEPTAPTVNSSKLSNLHHYWITESQMRSFYEQVWNTDLTDFVKGAFTGIYSNLISNVVSLKFMPTTATNLGGQGDASAVILGFKTYDDLTVQTVGTGVAPIVNIGSFKFTKEYNSFADYAPYTDVKLYLPFVGIITLDTNLFMGKGGGETATLNIKAQYDLQSGLITYFIIRNKTMVTSVSGNMAVEVPISLQSGLDTANTIGRNFANKATSFVGNAMSGNPIGMVSDVLQGSTSSPPQSIFSSTGGDGAFYNSSKCMMMIRHPQYNRPKTYSHVIGYPAFVSKKVSDLNGFNIIQHPEIPMTDGMTVAERDMIVSAMESGLHY